VFGGQIIAQSLYAAARTCAGGDPLMAPHSLHCYFLLPGSSDSPAIYRVRRVRDGRSFATRAVTATQKGRAIFECMVSFHSTREPTTLEHAEPMPDAPDPESLPDVRGLQQHCKDGRRSEADRHAPCPVPPLPQSEARHKAILDDPRLPEQFRPYVEHLRRRRDPIDFRYCEPVDVFDPKPAPARRMTWFRASRAAAPAGAAAAPGSADLGPSVLNQCLVAYASDSPLLATSLLPHALMPMNAGMMASIDHSLWFHAPAKAGEWLLFETTSPRLVSGRALCFGHVWRRDGVLVASAAQEGVVRTKLPRQVKPNGRERESKL